jgi:plasmid replication initiation protein
MRRASATKQAVRPAHELPAGKLQVTMSHALTTAAQGLSLAEKRVMMFAVAKLDAFKGDGGTATGIIKLVAHDYAEQFSVDPDTAYTQLKEAGKGIFNRYIRFFEQGRKGPEEVMVRWVSSARYSPGAGTVTLRFTPEVAPHLLQLKNQFTTYKLAQASALRSIYSWRLLEVLSQTASTGWRQIELDEFHHAMETPDGYKANFKILRQRVLEPAVKELCEKDGWLIEWWPLKTGRKVTALRFEFKRDPQGKLALEG